VTPIRRPDSRALARAGIAACGAPNVTLAAAHVLALGFADAAFDVVHAHQVPQHVGDLVRALNGVPQSGHRYSRTRLTVLGVARRSRWAATNRSNWKRTTPGTSSE
jgi:hypothetical protein